MCLSPKYNFWIFIPFFKNPYLKAKISFFLSPPINLHTWWNSHLEWTFCSLSLTKQLSKIWGPQISLMQCLGLVCLLLELFQIVALSLWSCKVGFPTRASWRCRNNQHSLCYFLSLVSKSSVFPLKLRWSNSYHDLVIIFLPFCFSMGPLSSYLFIDTILQFFIGMKRDKHFLNTVTYSSQK